MKYIATLMGRNHKCKRGTVAATDARKAWTRAYRYFQLADHPTIRLQVRPDPSDLLGLTMAALYVAGNAAGMAVKWTGGSKTQCAIDTDLRAARARLSGVTDVTRVMQVVASMGPDAQEYYSTCQLALYAAQSRGASVNRQYDDAYKAINAYIGGLRTRHETEVRTDYVLELGGNLVAVNRAIAHIIYGGARWVEAIDGTMDNDIAAGLGIALHNALRTCTARQRDIARMLCANNSQQDIADALRCSKTAVCRNVATLRKTVADHIRAHAPQYAYLLPSAPIDAAVQGSNVTGGRKDAAYYRAYRAARKAAQANANA